MKKKEEPKKVNSALCGICNKIIFFAVDDYVHLEDFHNGKFFVEGWYHTRCYNDKIKSSVELNVMKKKAMTLLSKAGEMIGIKEEPEEIVYV